MMDKNQLKIIHLVLGKGNPNRMNGVNKVAHMLAATQQQMGYEVQLWGIARNQEHDYPAREYETVLFQQHGNKLKLDSRLARAIAQLRQPAIVHMHGAFIPEFWQAGRLLRRQGIPYVYTPHGALTEGAMMRSALRKQVYLQLLERHLIEGAKVVHTLGIREYEYMSQAVPAARQKVIPNGQSLEEIPLFLEPANEVIHFGFLGRLDHYHKGLDLLLSGFSAFLSSGGQGHLHLVGDGPSRAMLEKMSQTLGIEGQVTFHGACFGKDKFRRIAACNVFVHPSRMEGFPVAVLEAAALGKPCLLSEATSVTPYIRNYHAGFALPENKPADICRAMLEAEELFHKGWLRYMGRRARYMVEDAFNWETIARQLIQTYTDEPACQTLSA